jgi:formate dehydrogenase major subunit
MKWPFLQQLISRDWTAFDGPAVSTRTRHLEPRTRKAEVVKSVCPYCAVGCGQDVHVLNGKIIDIEGDADSPISRGCLCPKGSATFQLVSGSHRVDQVLYRAPGAVAWQTIPLDRAMRMVAERVQRTREATWEDRNNEGASLRRTLGIAHLGGATLDIEENYVIKKLFTALGIIQIENQARI